MRTLCDDHDNSEITTCSPVSLAARVSADDPEHFDFRLLIANRIVERSREVQRHKWTREDVGLLLMEILEDEFGFDWAEPDAVDQFKELLVMAYVAAGDVLPVHQRAF